jgi:integrase
MAEFPIMRYLKVDREQKPKRDILEGDEFTNLRGWMTNVWCREKDIDDLERLKRRIFGLYLTIQYYGGFRNKEILGIRWKDITAIPTESKEDQRINRAVFIPAFNSKTGRSRSCVAPIAIQFERIRGHYQKAHIEINRDDFVFINLAKTKRGQNIPYAQPAMEKRLKSVVTGSGLQEKLDETGRHITQYSARHYAATNALMRGVGIYDLAVNLGTSVHYIETTYSHITAMMKSKELTKGQGYWKAIEERGELTELDLEESGDLPNSKGRSRGIAKSELRKAGALPDADGNYAETGH